MTAPKLIVYGTGRCGTKTLAAGAATLCWGNTIGHEALKDPVMPWAAIYAHHETDSMVERLRILPWPDAAIGYFYTPLIPEFLEAFPDVKVVQLTRDTEAVVASMIRKGWYLPADDDLPPVREWDRADRAWWYWPQNWRVRGDLTGLVDADLWAGWGQEQRIRWWIDYTDQIHQGDRIDLSELSWGTVSKLCMWAGLDVRWYPGFGFPAVLDNPEGGRPDTDHP